MRTGAFNVYDLDDNGRISREEMIKIIRSIYHMIGSIEEFKQVTVLTILVFTGVHVFRAMQNCIVCAL